MAEGIRVALLARPGTACEKLQAALQQAGADIVHVGDPAAGDVAALTAADPRAILVALEPAVEPALDDFEAILHDPARIVIYDEAELAARREGWDAARWSRHLAAKLSGHADVLPPGHEAAVELPVREEPEAHAPPRADLQPEAHAPLEADLQPEAHAPLEADLDPEVAEPAPLAPAAQEEPAGLPGMSLAGQEPAPTSAPMAAGSRAVTIEYSGGGLLDDVALAPMEGDAPAASESAPTVAATGGAVVLAGIGGPDAVRQFLAALPDRFPRPVLVRQRLDGGRHDRLVRQLQRATPLPVELATEGSPLAPGRVYILPDGMAAESTVDGLRFAETDGAPSALAGLDAGDSAVLLLSGADPALVDEVMALADAGTLVAGQSPEECFDNAAPGAAIARGALAGSPSQLAARLASRWTP